MFYLTPRSKPPGIHPNQPLHVQKLRRETYTIDAQITDYQDLTHNTHHREKPKQMFQSIRQSLSKKRIAANKQILSNVDVYKGNILHPNTGVKSRSTIHRAVNAVAQQAPIAWMYNRKSDSQMTYIITVFKNLGYKIHHNTKEPTRWDIMWSRPYPFGILKKLLPHQRVNHFPFSDKIFSKAKLATSNVYHIPKTFEIPSQVSDLLNYTKQHPEMFWVQKLKSHRGISIKKASELDLNNSKTFIQLYVDKPFLVDGRRFSLAIYVMTSSINPLRLYIYNDWVLRFCKQRYFPFDPNVTEKYIADGNFEDGWHIEPLKKYLLNEDISRKEAMLLYLQEQGIDISKPVKEMHDTIIQAFVKSESRIVKGSAKHGTVSNFFELSRFDFILDNNLDVYLMEANLSPMLYNAAHKVQAPLYKKLVYDAASITGLTSPSYVRKQILKVREMESGSPDVHVYSDICATSHCNGTCKRELCQFCKSCLSSHAEALLKGAYNEHLNRRGFRRIFPRTFQSSKEAANWKFKDDKSFIKLNHLNQWMTLWYRGKCIIDVTWCI